MGKTTTRDHANDDGRITPDFGSANEAAVNIAATSKPQEMSNDMA